MSAGNCCCHMGFKAVSAFVGHGNCLYIFYLFEAVLIIEFTAVARCLWPDGIASVLWRICNVVQML